MAGNQDEATGLPDGPGHIFSEPNSEWIEVADVMGATQAAVMIEYLRSQGIPAYQTGADNALSLNFGTLGTAHIMVPEAYLNKARFLLQSKDSVAIAYLTDDESGKEQLYSTQCSYCSTDLDLDEIEISQGWFQCPVCKEEVSLALQLSCPNCDAELALDNEDKSRGWYLCPECGQKSSIEDIDTDAGSDQINTVSREFRDDAPFETRCLQCDAELVLDEMEYAQGWYICPACNQLIDLEIQLTCSSCNTVLVLDDNERLRGWYICPACGEKSDIL